MGMSYIESWQKWLKRLGRSENTIIGYTNDVVPILQYKFGTDEDKSVVEYQSFTSDDLYNYLEEGKFSPATIGRKIASIKNFYKFLITDRKLFTLNPFDGMVRPSLTKPKSKALTEEETLSIFDKVQSAQYDERCGMRDYAIMTIFLSVPVRKSEIQDLLRTNYTDNGIIILEETKGGKNREIACSREMIQAIDAYLKTRKDDSQYLFVSERGNRISTHSMDWLIHKYANVNPHALRATSATNMYRNGVPIATIKATGGWDQSSNTFETHYLKVDAELKRTAVEDTMDKMRKKRGV